MTVNLDDRHMTVLEEMAKENDMSKTALLRQAIRLYQLVHERAKKGEQMAFTKDGVVVPLIVLSMLSPDV